MSKTFTGRGAAPLLALRDFSLRAASGEFVALVGPSGCGKSTLLRLVAGQIAPTEGTVALDGQPPAVWRARKGIAWMAQHPALLPWLTVAQNVELPLRVNRAHAHPAPPPAALLEMMGLAEFAGAYPAMLSGGMQQRVALARTLATGAPLWLMDEPFAALDELTREALTEEVLRLWSTFGPTVLWVTHHLGEALRLADRVVVLNARPGSVQAVIPVAPPRPRDETAPEMVALLRQLRGWLRGEARDG